MPLVPLGCSDPCAPCAECLARGRRATEQIGPGAGVRCPRAAAGRLLKSGRAPMHNLPRRRPNCGGQMSELKKLGTRRDARRPGHVLAYTTDESFNGGDARRLRIAVQLSLGILTARAPRWRPPLPVRLPKLAASQGSMNPDGCVSARPARKVCFSGPFMYDPPAYAPWRPVRRGQACRRVRARNQQRIED